jgi:hypothetical protein
MPFPKISSRESGIKNLDLTLSLEVPLAPSGSCNLNPDISLGPVKILSGISGQEECILGNFTESSMTGSLLSQDITGDQVP